MQLNFYVHNHITEVENATGLLQRILWQELAYPTETVMALQKGFVDPGNNGWDGWVRFFKWYKNRLPCFPSGMLSRAVRISEKMGFEPTVIDRRSRPDFGCPEFVDIPLRGYQQEAVKLALEKGMGVLDLPPRAGKTRTMIEIIRCAALPTVWVAPTDRIVRQTQEVVEGFFGKNFSVHLVGRAKEDDASRQQLVVCTAATANNLSQEFFDSRQVVVVDEWHHASAKTYKNMFKKCEHIFYRYGMTGTFFRSGHDAMAMHALLHDVVYKITSERLLELGHLVPTYACFLPVKAPRLRGLPVPTFQGGHGKYGIHEHEVRNAMAADAVLTLFLAGRRVLVLVGTKRQGRLLQAALARLLPPAPMGAEFKSVEFVSTDTDRPQQTRILESFVENQEVRVLIGTSLLGEGVDLPTADALVYARGEKAEVTLMQNIYRTCTAVSGKREAVVVDFSDRHNAKLLKHTNERARIYMEEPTFNLSVLEDAEQFPGWLKGVIN